MNLSGLVFLFVLYTLIVAAVVVATRYFVGRRRRGSEQGLPIPNITGLNIRPTSERDITLLPVNQSEASAETPVEVGGFASRQSRVFERASRPSRTADLGLAPRSSRPGDFGLAPRSPRNVDGEYVPPTFETTGLDRSRVRARPSLLVAETIPDAPAVVAAVPAVSDTVPEVSDSPAVSDAVRAVPELVPKVQPARKLVQAADLLTGPPATVEADQISAKDLSPRWIGTPADQPAMVVEEAPPVTTESDSETKSDAASELAATAKPDADADGVPTVIVPAEGESGTAAFLAGIVAPVVSTASEGEAAVSYAEDRPVANLEDRPVANLEDRPVANLEDRPNANLADRPVANLEYRPVANLEDRPEANLADCPEANLADRPDANLADAFAGVFVAGAILPEALRTLEVSPHRVIEPNSTVRAGFTFRNPGGGIASGFRARFYLPEGLTYTPGSAHIDASPLGDEDGRTALLEARGADIGDVPAGGERRISLEFTVAKTIENGTAVALQAAIASADVPVIGSNIVRLVVRSRPVLQNSLTALALVAVGAAVPGEELALTARVHNSGESSAHDLMVLLPVPAHTTVSPQTVTIDGRPIVGTSQVGNSPQVSFGFGRPTVVAPLLAPGGSVDIGYRVRIETPLEDGTPIVARGTVCSREIAEFALQPVTLEIPSAASFDGNETSLTVECAEEVQPGERLRIVLRAKNVGTAAARYLSLSIVLPEGMLYMAGSLAIDGALAPDRGALPSAIRLADLGPGTAVELELTAIVQSPISDGQRLRPAAKVTWSKGERRFFRDIVARSAPRFPAPFNKIERESAQRVGPGDVVWYSIALANMGTDVATGVRVKLSADPGLEEIRVRDSEMEIALGDDLTVSLDTLEPGVSRFLRVSGRVAGIIEDQKRLRLHAALQTDQVAYSDLGSQIHVVESRPRFSAATSRIIIDNAAAWKFNERNTCRLLLVNDGTDFGRDVRVTLLLPEELRLDGVDNARHDEDTISFGDIAAGEKREAIFYVTLVGMVAAGEPLAIAARVGGLNVVPFSLCSTQLTTLAEASFAEGATLTSEPVSTVDAGAAITYTLYLRNSGDGAAKYLTARIVSLTNAVYAQGSTTVNTIALSDYAGTSLLLSEGGLRLADVGAGVEIVVSWRAIVNMPLPPGTAIESAASIQWDAGDEIIVAVPPVFARSTSSLPIIDPELPFSVLGAIAARGVAR